MTSLYLSPSGNLYLRASLSNETSILDKIKEKFLKQGVGAGLLELNRLNTDLITDQATLFFRKIAALFLNELCHTPKEATIVDPISLPNAVRDLDKKIPLMDGAEYFNENTIPNIWDDFNRYSLSEIHNGNDIEPFLKSFGVNLHQVGRVCFHLAENKEQHEDFPFAFLATYAAGLTKQGHLKYLPLYQALQEYAGAQNKKALVNLLGPIQKASEKSKFIQELLENGEIYHPYPITADEAFQFLNEVQLYEESGLLVKIPDWWAKKPKAKVSVSVDAGRDVNTKGLLSAENLVNFEVAVSIGNLKLTKNELKTLLNGERGLRFVKGAWVEVDPEKIKSILAYWESKQSGQNISVLEALKMMAGFEEKSEESNNLELVAKGRLQAILEGLNDPNKIKDEVLPKGLKATLRPYQKVGVNWLSQLSSLGIGSCLADDMGLGKTIQVITFLLKQKENNTNATSLLVVPASLVGNWKSEIEKFAPSLKFICYHSGFSDAESMNAIEKKPKTSLKNVDLLITTYGMLLRQKWFHKVIWGVQILDEAQAIKNPNTKQTKAVKKINSTVRIALTGTPVENKLLDLWSLFDFTNPGLLGTQSRFVGLSASLAKGSSQFAPLRNFISPYILRRLKTDKSIIKDLPDKTEVQSYCYLTKTQAAAYQACVHSLEKSLLDAEGIQRRGIVLSFLTQLKQICNHPSQQKGDDLYHEEASGKFKRLRDLCEEISAKQEKVIIFSQYKEILPALHRFLSDIFDSEGYVLHGGTKIKDRKEMVDEFQKENGKPFFLLSLKAGGAGLNLTAASHVIHFDRWWNPAVENQATDRAFRIGQKKNVLVHKFISKGTLEEKIDELISDKKQIADSVLSTGAEKLITEMSNSEIMRLVSLNLNEIAN